MSRRFRSVLSLIVCFSMALYPMDKTLAVPVDGYKASAEFRQNLALQLKITAVSWSNSPFVRSLLLLPQAPPNLDAMRAGTPALPDPPNGINVSPPTGYDDPKPTNSANFAAYYTESTKAKNDVGAAGGKPMQNTDPTSGSAAVGGISVNMDSGNFSFTTSVLGLTGRAGLDLSLPLTYNSRVWTKQIPNNNVWPDYLWAPLAFNTDKGFPGPGWRIGFGVIQGINNSGNIGPYTSSITSKQSFLYIAPDGTRRELAYNSTSLRYESYDSSYLEFNATTRRCCVNQTR